MILHLMSTWNEIYIQPAVGGGAVGKAEYLSARPSLSNARLPVSFLARSQEQPRLSLVVTSVGRFEVARLRRIN